MNFVQRVAKLGFGADRLSLIGYDQWQHIAEMRLPDHEAVQALAWCEAHPGMTWRPQKPTATADEIRATAKMIYDIEASPESFRGGLALAKICRELIARHIANGTCPPDVATFFAPPPEPEPPP